jgi:DNA-directed RNA polymerase subunit M/transcription elongation factor TFIIS
MAYEDFYPLVFWWIAFYNDGTCLPKFDIKTGKENSFKDIDQTKLDKFGLFPFNASFALKVNLFAGKTIARDVENLPYFIMKFQVNQRPIYVRRCAIHTFSYQHCDKCGYEWQWMPTHKDGEKTEVDLLTHPNYVMQEWQGKKYPCAQCPKCGSFNSVVCPECKDTLISEMKGAKEGDGHIFKCQKCKKEYPRYIKYLESSLRGATYLFGYQTTIEGENHKQIMFISEDGTFELNENFNYK